MQQAQEPLASTNRVCEPVRAEEAGREGDTAGKWSLYRATHRRDGRPLQMNYAGLRATDDKKEMGVLKEAHGPSAGLQSRVFSLPHLFCSREHSSLFEWPLASGVPGIP